MKESQSWISLESGGQHVRMGMVWESFMKTSSVLFQS